MESVGGTVSHGQSKSLRLLLNDVNNNAVRNQKQAVEGAAAAAAEPRFALSVPNTLRAAMQTPERHISRGTSAGQRPMSAKARLTSSPAPEGKSPDRVQSPTRQFGRQSVVLDNGHQLFGPKVLRNLDPPRHGFPARSADDFLKKGDGRSLQGRNRLQELLKNHPVNKEPAFQPGNGGVKLSWESCPSAQPSTIFRHLYDNGSLDFVTVDSGTGLQNHLNWGRAVKRGMMVWGGRPSEVELGKWLPIFLEGVREYQEPYRFIAIIGSEDLIIEAGGQLHEFAADLVPPFKKALDTRIPTVVAVAVELMHTILKVDIEVAKTWIYYLPQFCQVFNLFSTRGFLVNKGYNRRDVTVIKESISEVLTLLELNGGANAVPLMRRYSRSDPAITLESMARSTQRAESKEGYQPWKPYTLA